MKDNPDKKVRRDSPEYLKRFAGSYNTLHGSHPASSYRHNSGSYIRFGSGSYRGSGSGVLSYFGYGIDLI